MNRRRRIRWRWLHRATALAFLAVLVAAGLLRGDWLRGSMTATTWFGVLPISDPLAVLEITLTSRTWHNDALLGAAVLLAAAVLLGPVFCGWICPLGLLMDLAQTVRGRVLRRLGLRTRRASHVPSRSRALRYFMLGGVIGFALLARVPMYQAVSPINVVAWSLLFASGPALWFVLALIVLEAVFPRLWCRSLCPTGALYDLVGRRAKLRVWVNQRTAGRLQCRRCSVHCPMGIRVMEDYTLAGRPHISDPACTRCGDCIDVCPGDVLRLGFGAATPPEPNDASQPYCPGCDHGDADREEDGKATHVLPVLRK
ncbi:MAG: 4Fe-4S binding protein [Planctomycetota bacterium]|nr:MAG: 4Fe-4S binding protein [Planctomycetota bacterium]